MMPPTLYSLPKLKASPASLLRPLAIAACLAGIVHIGVTFAMPMLAGQSAYARLTGTLPLNAMAVLPAVTPRSQPLPYLGADARYAMCRYDTRDGSVAVEASLPDAGWLLAVYSPDGDTIYYVPGQPERTSQVSLVLVPPGEHAAAGESEVVGPRPDGDAIVASHEGLVVLRAPSRGLAYEAETVARLRAARCIARPRPNRQN